ncbi:hypothetical protein C8R45DRAFT_972891 [Mycena sanguinolenta]|nr:hypothetical protein C8R45DRAFT_972891 [Mycena sanguinolenta]
MDMEPIPSSSRTNHDDKSIASSSITLVPLASPPAPSRPTPPADDVHWCTNRGSCIGYGCISFISWAASISACLVQYFRLVHSAGSGSELGFLLAWIACSAAFLIFIPIFFVSALMRRPSKRYLGKLRRVAIWITVISTIIALGAFPVLGGCTGNKCFGRTSGLQAGLALCIASATFSSVPWAF